LDDHHALLDGRSYVVGWREWFMLYDGKKSFWPNRMIFVGVPTCFKERIGQQPSTTGKNSWPA
jgi:hypothetical protein